MVLAVAAVTAAVTAIVIGGQSMLAHAQGKKNIVGAWYVDTVGAPFVPHGMLFHADGTLSLTNPDAAEATNSSSAGYGQWRLDRGKVHGRFFEVNADKNTNLFTTLLVVTFTIKVDGDTFMGLATAEYFDKDRRRVQGPFPAELLGQRFEVTGPIPDPKIP
jgi:hypothetical protein